MTPLEWMIIAVLGVLWVLIALHTALALRDHGRRLWVWFLVSIFLTVIPATIIAHLDYLRFLRRRRDEMRAGVRRCPHCGAELPAGVVGMPSACPVCGREPEQKGGSE